MRSRLLALGRQTAVYGLAGVSVQVVGLVTLPVFARAFSPAEYGVLEVVNVVLAAVMLLADLGLGSAMQRNFYDHPPDDRDGQITVTSTAVSTSTALAIVLATAVVTFRTPLSELMFDTPVHADLVALAGLGIPLAVLANLFREIMRLHFRAGHFVVSSALTAAVTGFGGVFAVTSLDEGVAGVLIASVAGLGCATVYGFFVVRADLTPRVSMAELRSLLRYGLPLVPAAVALWGLSLLDRVMLSRLASLADAGQYAVATRFSSVLMFVVIAFATAYSPFLFSMHMEDPEGERRLRGQVLTYLAILLVGLALALALVAEPLAAVVTPGFEDAHTIVGVLALGVAFYGLSNVTLVGISLARKTESIAIYTGIAVAFNVVLNLVLIPPLGIVGAALATTAAYGLLAAAYYRRSQRLEPAPFEPRKVVGAVVVGAALMPLGVVHLGSLAADVAARAGALVVFAGVLIALRIIDPAELRSMRALVRRPAS